jgi:hypothetical protein
MPDNFNNDRLWQLAKKRAAFKASLVSYFVINSFLIAIWFFASGVRSYFWPVWPMLGWGLGLAFQYFSAYHGNRAFTAEEEYKKLVEEEERKQTNR